MAKKKLIEEELESAKEELQILKEDIGDLVMYIDEFASFVPLPVCMVSPSGLILDTNKAFQDLFGYNRLEIVGKPIETPFLEKKEVEKVHKEILERKVLKGKELTAVSKRKKKIPVSISAYVRKDREGTTLGYFMGIVEITEIKAFRERLEEKVKERTKELEMAKKSLEEAKNILEVKVSTRTKELQELTKNLEDQVKERTKELQGRIDELERFHRLTVGRELKMIELKKEIEKLNEELGKKVGKK